MKRTLIAYLPAFVQDHLVTKAMQSGKIFKTPVFEMLLRTLEFYGGNIEDIRNVFTQVNKNTTVQEIADKKADEKIALATDYLKLNKIEAARNTYFDAMVYFFLMEFFTDSLIESEKHYKKFMPIYEKYCELAEPSIQRVTFDHKNGAIKTQFRQPKGDGPFPAVIFFPGNEAIKEHMIKFESYAHQRGIATLSVDPPGYGESRLTGIIWETEEDFRICVKKSVDYLYSLDSINNSGIGIFGASGGGLTAPYAASIDKRISASAGLGGPSPYTLVSTWDNAIVSQKRKTFRYSGTNNFKDCRKWMHRLQNDLQQSIHNISVPNLWVNGTDDLVVDINDIKHLTTALGELSEFLPIEGGDHLCSQFLSTGLADKIFDWFEDKLS